MKSDNLRAMFMRRFLCTATIVFALPALAADAKGKIMLVIHGGAGTITRASMTAEREAQYRAGLAEAMKAGHAILVKGGTSLDAVEATIRVMEDSPLFNAGKGAVFTHEGKRSEE